MKNTKKIVLALAVILAVALVSSLTTLAVTNYGSRDDPLVTLSYLNDTVTPGIMSELQKAIDAKAGQTGTTAPGGAAESGFAVITLSKGQTLVCEVGTEIMLRIGTAQSAGADSPRLVDTTSGSTLADAGKDLAVNHLYMITIAGNGVTATADGTKLLIRGSYTLS